MGVSITCEGTERSMDLGYSGFARLRYKVAELAGEEWYNHYKDGTMKAMRLFGEERDALCREFDEKTQQLLDEKKVSPEIVDFCLQSDAEGTMEPEQCSVLLETIGDYNDEILYGYVGRKDCARFRDFKAILMASVETETPVKWW